MKKFFTTALIISSALHISAQQNSLLDMGFWRKNPDVEAVKTAIEKGNDPLQLNAQSNDAIVMAINSGASNAVIEYLLAQPNVDVNRLTHDGRIYLHWAANKGNVAIVEYLLAKKSDMNLEDSHGVTPLTFAAGNGQQNTALYEAFFKAGLDVKKKYKDGANILLLTIATDKDFILTNYFISKGLSITSTDAEGNTAFNYAARAGNVAFLKTLVDKGVKFNNGALLMAAQGLGRRGAAKLDLYQYLVNELRLQPTVKNKEGESVLHLIAQKPEQLEVMQFLVEKGADVNAVDKEGNTVLMHAAGGRDVALVNYILSKSNNLNAQNLKGESALMNAVKAGSVDVLNLLLAKGADTQVKSKEGNTLAGYWLQSYRPAFGRGGAEGRPNAPQAGMPAMERRPESGSSEGGRPNGGEFGARPQDDFEAKQKALQEKGVNFAATQKEGNTLWHLAVIKGDINLLKMVSKLSIDINAKNKAGLTALHKAAMVSKDASMLQYLLELGAKKTVKTDLEETAYDLAKENNFLKNNKISIEFLQ